MIMNAVFTSKLDCPFISYNYYYISTKKCNGELIAVTFLTVLKKKSELFEYKETPIKCFSWVNNQQNAYYKKNRENADTDHAWCRNALRVKVTDVPKHKC